jgi:DNA sulfur modification protein DndB
MYMSGKSTKKLWLPALRGHMGDWIYYVTLMSMCDLASRVSATEQVLHTNKTMNEYAQLELELSKHAGEIANYLLSQPQRFFSSVVIGIYGEHHGGMSFLFKAMTC